MECRRYTRTHKDSNCFLNMPNLPTKIVLCILELAYYTRIGYVDYTTLCRCSLVCRIWRVAAQALLIKTVALRLPQVVPSHFIRENNNDILVLNVIIGHNKAKSIPPLMFSRVLIHCPRLYELGIHAGDIDSFEEDVMQRLSASMPPFRALRIKSIYIQSTLPYQLLSIGSSVRHLSIGEAWDASPPFDSEPIKHSLYELTISNDIPLDPLKWLLSKSVGSLELLEIPNVRLDDAIQWVMDTHGQYIRSLRIPSRNLEALGMSPGFPNLDELVVLGGLGAFAIFDIPSSNWQLSAMITHLAFKDYDTKILFSLARIFDIITALPNLRLLSWHESVTTHTDFPKLQTVCAKGSIELAFHSYDRWMDEDMIPDKRYPRRKSFSNFRSMVKTDVSPPPPPPPPLVSTTRAVQEIEVEIRSYSG